MVKLLNPSEVMVPKSTLKDAMEKLFQVIENSLIKDSIKHELLGRLEKISNNMHKVKSQDGIAKLTNEIENLTLDQKITKCKIVDLKDLVNEHMTDSIDFGIQNVVYDDPVEMMLGITDFTIE